MSPNQAASKPMTARTRTSTSQKPSSKSTDSSKLAAKMHALKTVARRRLISELLEASSSTQSLAEELHFTPVNSSNDTDALMDENNEITVAFHGGDSAEYERFNVLDLDATASLPSQARSLTPNSKVLQLDTIPQEPMHDQGALVFTSMAPVVASASLAIEKVIPTTKIVEINSEPVPTIELERKDTLNLKALSQTKTDLNQKAAPANKQSKPSSKLIANTSPGKPAGPKVIKSKVSELAKPFAAETPTRNPSKASTIPQRIYSEIATGASTSKVATSHETTLPAPESQAPEPKKIAEQKTDEELEKVSEAMSFLPSMNDECTVEDSMYPFKLVLSPLEERPLEKGPRLPLPLLASLVEH